MSRVYRSRPRTSRLARAVDRFKVRVFIFLGVIFTIPALLARCGVGPR